MTEKRYYSVLADSLKHGGERIARVWPGPTTDSGFWTGTEPDRIWKMTREDADEVISKLGYNRPQIVRFEKAVKIIEAQRDARLGLGKEAPLKTPPGVVAELADAPGDISLLARCLGHEYGFGAGGLIKFWMDDLDDARSEHAGLRERVDALGDDGDRKVLVALVREHLAPLLPGVEIEETSCDNPVMADTEEGRDFCRECGIEVRVGVRQVVQAIEKIEREAEVLPSP